MTDKVFLGSGKERVFNDGGSIISQSLDLSKIVIGLTPEMLTPEVRDYCTFHSNGSVYLNTDVKRKREVDQYGKTHYTELNTFQPSGGSAPAQNSQSAPTDQEENPFF